MPGAPKPSTDPLVALADRCVQCGLCLPTCPTYSRERLEAESPRGRIALVRAWSLHALEPTASGDQHLDQCLGCRNCESACPAGVEYGALLAGARRRQRNRRGVRPLQRLLEFAVRHPRLLTVGLEAYRRLHRWLPARLRPLPRPPAPPSPPRRSGGDASPVALFVGCVAGAYEPGVRAALHRFIGGLGMALTEPRRQGCCGSVHLHAGAADTAAVLGARNRAAFAGNATVLTLASGCHESLAQSLSGAALVQDALAFIEARADALAWRSRPERVALHLPCTQRNVVRSVDATRRLLARVPGLEVVELDAGFGCCGAAGTQAVTHPARADGYRQPLLAQFAASGATRLLSANIGCRLHLAQATDRPVQHPLEFLAQCLADDADLRAGALH